MILAYTVVAMHANFILCLFQLPSDQHHSMRTCLQSCGLCLRRFFRRFSFCCVICVWSFSFTATIPLLYTIDSTEKVPKPVYCPGTTTISYREEWFDRNRFMQSMIFNVIPLIMNLFLTAIALFKLLSDSCVYVYLRLRTSKCCLCKKKSFSLQRNYHQQQPITTSSRLLPPISVIGSNPISGHVSFSRITETTSSVAGSLISSSSYLTVQPCGRWFSRSSLRLLLVLSTSLLACIYPVAMRFYLIYFSAIVPMLFAVLNYSLGNLTLTQQTTVENRTTSGAFVSTPVPNEMHDSINKLYQGKPTVKQEKIHSSKQDFELKTPLIINNALYGQDESFGTISTSSPSSSNDQQHQSFIDDKRTCFSNRLYENSQTVSIKQNN